MLTRYMKTYALMLLFSGHVIAGFSQETPGNDTSVIAKELVISTASASIPDISIIGSVNTVEKKEQDLSTSSALLTLHPRAIPFVKDYLDENEERLMKMKVTAIPYFRLIDKIMQQHNLPRELKYLAVIESELKSSAVSWAGAVGPWQFMPETGRVMGLTVNRHRDDRRDLTRSTQAAAKYLKELYAELNDWLLVIAAYNGGSARVQYAIRKSGSRNFFDLQYYLPAESRMHVKKFIATHYIMEGQGGITTTVKGDTKRLNLIQPTAETLDNTLLQTLTGKYSSAVVAKSLDMDILLFNQLNPGFDAKVAVDSYGMRLPDTKMALFNEKKMDILNESIQYFLTNSLEADNKTDFPREIKLPARKPSK